MDNKNNKSYYVVFLVISLILFIYYLNAVRKNNLEESGIYTVGKVIDSYPVIGYFNYQYQYQYQNEVYYGTNSNNENLEKKVGKYFIVKLSKQDPENSTLLLKLPVCDSVINSPELGWKTIPKEVICSPPS